MEMVLLVESLPFISLYFTIVGKIMRFFQVCCEIVHLIFKPMFCRVFGFVLDTYIVKLIVYLYTTLKNFMKIYFILTAAFIICATTLLMNFIGVLCELVTKDLLSESYGRDFCINVLGHFSGILFKMTTAYVLKTIQAANNLNIFDSVVRLLD